MLKNNYLQGAPSLDSKLWENSYKVFLVLCCVLSAQPHIWPTVNTQYIFVTY